MLTEEQINAIQEKILTPDPIEWMQRFARAIESAVSASKAAEYAYIRREARNAALEEAAKVFIDCPLWGISPEAAEEMVLALKDQP